ncbi:PREDICTED: transcription factor bHLH145-like [Ipomoea nil]|uniref:transcription factor bHLH145-like n=1 Tax=Ipomoea nil TaxID=35883 RepID=UPI000901451D|nr:PREDICTED: transcription factor bHLH145-like [Ipomoea nil]XP_019174935.1 PREDICTED: transcription factor bHLH145-like [Ipomoea nil]
MEKDFGSWFNHQCFGLQSAPLNSSGAQSNIGKGDCFSVYMNSQFNEVSTNGDFPLLTFSARPQSKAGQPEPDEPRNWFNCSPCFPRDVSTSPNPVPIEKLPSGSVENCNTGGTGCSLKKFLVFDKSDDQTTLIYSSANCTPAQCPESWSPKPHGAYNLIREHPGINRNEEASPLGNLIIDDDYVEESHRDLESEWHEDTDELNALIYCDNDYDYLEEDEVTSTDRSPSTMTVHEERGEEVESSAGPTKRHKLLDGGHNVLSFTHTATTAKPPHPCSEVEDDAGSSCGGNDSNEVSGLSGIKRSREEKIRKTISILQMIIPGVKGKDAMLVIDETIQCLRSLKAEAQSLGL